MKLLTEVLIDQAENLIDHEKQLLLIGSCFAGNIGQKLMYYKFQASVNPVGILYNPLSIAQSMQKAIDNYQYTPDDLCRHDELYLSMDFHSDFSALDEHSALQKMNLSIFALKEGIEKSNTIYITFGTAWAYFEEGYCVANCHKFSASRFTRRRLDVEEIVEEWENLINQIIATNPAVQIVFTVSPVRHIKDGAQENQLSKASLLLAIDQLKTRFRQVNYFPAYEIMMDELRDYRFYKTDLVHPNEQALTYVWERFAQFAISTKSQNKNKKLDKFRSKVLHKPHFPSSVKHQAFLKHLKLELRHLEQSLKLDLSRELEIIEEQEIGKQ